MCAIVFLSVCVICCVLALSVQCNSANRKFFSTERAYIDQKSEIFNPKTRELSHFPGESKADDATVSESSLEDVSTAGKNNDTAADSGTTTNANTSDAAEETERGASTAVMDYMPFIIMGPCVAVFLLCTIPMAMKMCREKSKQIEVAPLGDATSVCVSAPSDPAQPQTSSGTLNMTRPRAKHKHTRSPHTHSNTRTPSSLCVICEGEEEGEKESVWGGNGGREGENETEQQHTPETNTNDSTHTCVPGMLGV
eukprot:GDKI01031352.1.p1 GENE.GDKI01031352.1~~GDKI01031352.1.p1  ORF type:complete len:253 (+),score=42.11 GDKI01031352.1:122-880(+)